MTLEMLAQQLGHLDDVADGDSQSFFAEQFKIGQGRKRAHTAARGLESKHAGTMLAELIEIRHLILASAQQSKIVAFFEQHQARNIRREAGLVKIDADGIGQIQMANALAGAGQRAHRARPKTQRIRFKIVVAKDLPSPTDYRIGMNVRPVGQLEFTDQLVAQSDDRREIVEAERVRRAQGRDDCGDRPAALQRRPGLIAQDIDAASRCAGRSECVIRFLRAQTEPTGDVVAAVVARSRWQK